MLIKNIDEQVNLLECTSISVRKDYLALSSIERVSKSIVLRNMPHKWLMVYLLLTLIDI